MSSYSRLILYPHDSYISFFLLFVMAAVGALCEYSETETSELIRQICGPYDNYTNSLDIFCSNSSQFGMLIWTPDENTPDLVYYQV